MLANRLSAVIMPLLVPVPPPPDPPPPLELLLLLLEEWGEEEEEVLVANTVGEEDVDELLVRIDSIGNDRHFEHCQSDVAASASLIAGLWQSWWYNR